MNEPASTSTTGSSTSCSRPGSSPSSRCTTGISRRRSRTAAAGRRARPSRRSRSTSRSSSADSATACATGSRSASRGSSRGSATASAIHAPGRTSEADALAAAHHVLLSHGLAAPRCSARAPEAEVGITIDLVAFHPLTVSRGRRRGGGRRWTAPATAGSSTRCSAAAYPEDMLEHFADPSPRSKTATCRRSPPRSTSSASTTTRATSFERIRTAARRSMVAVEGTEHTEMGWEVYPDGLYELLVRCTTTTSCRRSTSPRTGRRSPDHRSNGSVPDPQRISYVERHSAAIARAVEDGVPCAVLPLVAARQLRVVAGLLAALRHRLRRLRDARARAQGELPLVPRLHRRSARLLLVGKPSDCWTSTERVGCTGGTAQIVQGGRSRDTLPTAHRIGASASPVFLAGAALLAPRGRRRAREAEPTDRACPEDVRSISYFPARGGWTLMWTRFDAEAIDRDLVRVAWLRANTVRVIVPPARSATRSRTPG